MDRPLKVIDHSARHVLDTCRRKYYFAYELQLQTERSIDLERGSTVHRGLYEWYRTGDEKKAIDAAKMEIPSGLLAGEAKTYEEVQWAIQELLAGYFKQFPKEEFNVVALEKPVAMQLRDGWWYVGMVDAEIEHPILGLLIKEDKSTKMIPTDWVAKFQMDNQTVGYVVTERSLGRPVKGVLLNLLRMTKYPDYVREVVMVSEDLADEWLAEIYTIIDEIEWRRGLIAKGMNPFAVWTKNTDACFQFNKECAFRKICLYTKDREVLLRDFYKKKEQPNREDGILARALEGRQNEAQHGG